MSAYQYPASAPTGPYAADAATDPTAVMGRRIGAWIVDLLLFLLLSSFFGPTPLSPLAEYVEVPAGVHDACGTLQDNGNAAGCVTIGDRAYFTSDGDAAVQFLVSLAWFLLIYGALQGLRGITPGKALFGVQVVDRQGQPPGVGRSLVRSLLWIVDGAPWCFPLVGLITALISKGHRRVGDMVANTLVVGKAYAGRPVVVPGLTVPEGAAYAAAGYGAPGGWPQPGYPGAPASPPPAQPWGASPPGAPGWAPPGGAGTPAATPAPGATPAAGPPPGGYPPPSSPYRPPPASGETPARSPYAPPEDAPSPAPAPGATGAGPAPPAPAGEPGGPGTPPGGDEAGEPEPGAGDEAGGVHPPGGAGTPGGAVDSPAGAGSAGPAAGEPAPGPAAGGATGAGSGQQAGSGYNPQWDAARNTYIVWEPSRGRWLGWDDAAKEWKPL